MNKTLKHILFFTIFAVFNIAFSSDVNAEEFIKCSYNKHDVNIIITKIGEKLEYEFDKDYIAGYEVNNLNYKHFEGRDSTQSSCPVLYINCESFKAGIMINNPFCLISSKNDGFFDNLFGTRLRKTEGTLIEKSDSEIENLPGTFTCEGQIGILGDKNDEDSVAWLIVKILDYIKIFGPSLMVLLTGVDYVKIVFLGDDELNKKMHKRLVIRFICLLLLFFIPMFVEFSLDLFGLTGCSSLY